MDFDRRERLIYQHFISKMNRLYMPPNNIKGNKDSMAEYCREIRRVINERISTKVATEEYFVDIINKIWDQCIKEHTMRLWFSPSLCIKATQTVMRDQYRVIHGDEIMQKQIEENQKERARGDKTDPASQGWTVETCDAAIAHTKEQIDAGKLPRGIGMILIRIPEKAKERLLNQTA